jgi:hypothetical protein
MPELSPGLGSLLAVEPSNERAVREIASNPRLLAEARQALPQLQAAAKAQAGTDGVYRVVFNRIPNFPQPDRSEEEWAAWWGGYFTACAELPESALEAGMAEWLKAANHFMPAPGELRQLALTTPNRAARAAERARAAIEYQPPKTHDHNPVTITPRILRDEPTAAEKQRIREMAAAFSAAVEARKPPPIDAFKCKAKVDEMGITAEMRALMERRAEGDAA